MTTIKHRVAHTGVIAVAAAMAAMTVTPALANSAPASAGKTRAAPDVKYTFRKLDNASDPTFNQLLGINNHGRIVGFYGSGAPGHRNRGYQLAKPYKQADYRAENYPGSAQTEVTGINDSGISVGLFANTNNAYAGFYLQNGHFHRVAIPTGNNFSPPFDELLGINNGGMAVGDFEDSAGDMHAYRYSTVTHKFTRINVKNSANVTATAINVGGTIVGFFTTAAGNVDAFLRHANGSVRTFAKHGAEMTQAFGINKAGVVVGAYTMGSSTVGFTWSAAHGFQVVNDPHGVGFTVINGINNAGDLVGFYTDSRGNTNGLLATP
jgi:probable HAF family extracellular repeat protein